MNIVFLERATIGPGVIIKKPDFEHQWVEYDKTPPGDILNRLQDADIAIVNKCSISAGVIDQLPKLKMIAMAATGYDCIDVKACKKRNIVVSNIRGYAKNTVPEHTFSLLLALARNLPQYRDEVLQGKWQEAGQFCFFNRPIPELGEMKLGIIGFGIIGRSVANIAHAFGMEVLFYDEFVKTSPSDAYQKVDLKTLITKADAITCHCPLTEQTKNLISDVEFDQMQPTALVINTARGGIIDEEALIRAIEQNKIAGAGIDVLSVEPPPLQGGMMDLARKHNNVLLTPHTAWASRPAMQALSDQMIDNINLFFKGKPRHNVAV